jgi:hypothetical protein
VREIHVTDDTVFASDRERRLWGWAFAVLAAIYGSAAFAGALAEALRDRGLLGVAFGVGFVSAVVAVVGNAVKRDPRGGEPWVALGVAVVYGMVIVRVAVTPEERTHLFEYGLLAVLVLEALSERLRNGRRVPLPAVVAVVATSLLGWVDEGIQAVLPGRVYDLRDVGVNALAGLMAVAASLALARARSWTRC